jgi:hypothetical protein
MVTVGAPLLHPLGASIMVVLDWLAWAPAGPDCLRTVNGVAKCLVHIMVQSTAGFQLRLPALTEAVWSPSFLFPGVLLRDSNLQTSASLSQVLCLGEPPKMSLVEGKCTEHWQKAFQEPRGNEACLTKYPCSGFSRTRTRPSQQGLPLARQR